MRKSIFLLLASVAAADDVLFTSGQTESDVKVIEQTAAQVVYVGRNLKPVKMPAAVVRAVTRKRSTIHEYDDRLAAAKDGAGMGALAEWARERKFAKGVVEELWRRTLELDANHEAANLALGRVLHDGAWMTPEERDRRVREGEEAAQRAKGLVPHEGRWVTPEERANLEKGLVLHEGRWMTPDEAKLAQGLVKLPDGRWVRKEDQQIEELLGGARAATGLGEALLLKQTPHYAILGDLAENELVIVAATMDKLFDEWTRLVPDDREANLLPGKHRLYCFKRSPPYQKLVRYLHAEGKRTENWSQAFAQQEEARMKMRLGVTSFWITQPQILSAHVQMPDPFEGLRAHCVHFGANILATRSRNPLRFPTWWLLEGIAYHFEQRVTGTIQTYNAGVGGGGYADAGPVESAKQNPWLDASRWPQLLLGLVQSNRDTPLETLKGRDLFSEKNQLTTEDLVKAHSVVTFLIEDDARKFAQFFHDAKCGPGSTPVERETAAAIRHYGGYEKIEAAWRRYALNNFRIVR